MSSSRSRPWVRDSSRWTFRQSGVDSGVGADGAVDVGVTEESANAVHHRHDRGVHQPGIAELADVELDVCPLDPDQRVKCVGFAPGEPAS